MQAWASMSGRKPSAIERIGRLKLIKGARKISFNRFLNDDRFASNSFNTTSYSVRISIGCSGRADVQAPSPPIWGGTLWEARARTCAHVRTRTQTSISGWRCSHCMLRHLLYPAARPCSRAHAAAHMQPRTCACACALMYTHACTYAHITARMCPRE